VARGLPLRYGTEAHAEPPFGGDTKKPLGLKGAAVFLMIWMERVMGIEPTLFAWEARVLPLNDTREAHHYRAAKCTLAPVGSINPERTKRP
jgi:hypothetical protein